MVRQLLTLYMLIIPICQFVFGKCGSQYGVSFFRKLLLVMRFLRNSRTPGSASVWGEHITLAAHLLEVPKDLVGDVAEFGCFKGLSTASLSLACALTNRRLYVFDSFCGLPETDEEIVSFSGGGKYQQGQYAGSLEEVKTNVAKYGNISVCEFVPGFFNETLPVRQCARITEKYVFIFEDVDLRSSLEDVLVYAWPRLQSGCYFFSHEATDLHVVSVFFDNDWWAQNIQMPAPGFAGSGLGLPLHFLGSCLGYTRKQVASSTMTTSHSISGKLISAV